MSVENTEETTEIIVPEIKAFSPDVFDPKKEQLQIIADEVAKIEADPSKMDKDTLTLVNATKNKLVKARTMIEKTGKALRDPHTAFNKAVSAYENELIAIIEPQEIRLKAIEADAKTIAIREERRLTLPEFKAKLAAIGDKFIEKFIDEANYDEYLLTLDPNQRDAYYNERLGSHLQAQKAESEAKAAEEAAAKAEEQRKIDEEKAEIEREKESLALEKLNGRIQRLLVLGFKDVGSSYAFEECTIAKDSLKTLDNDVFDNFINGATEYVENIKETAAAAAEAQKQSEIKAAEEAAAAKAKEQAEKEAAEKEAKRLADEEAERKAKEEWEAKEKAEAEARQSAEAFQSWLNENSYRVDTDRLGEEHDADRKVTILYREVSRYTHGS